MIRKGVALVAAVLSVTIGLSFVAQAASAKTTATVLLVHGFQFDSSPGVDCAATWKTVKSELTAQGHGNVKTVGYYAGDKNCDIMLGKFDQDIPIEDIAKKLAATAATLGTVDLIGHSMGGLIATQALSAAQAKEGGYTNFKANNLVTAGTPFGGSPLALACTYRQCAEMRPGSNFLGHLNAIDFKAGDKTDTTTLASYMDAVVPWMSAQPDGSKHAVTYMTGGHSDYLCIGGSGTKFANSRMSITASMSFTTSAETPAHRIATAIASGSA